MYQLNNLYQINKKHIIFCINKTTIEITIDVHYTLNDYI